jgi:hypothetical protein
LNFSVAGDLSALPAASIAKTEKMCCLFGASFAVLAL